jgi:hypothetical protein
MAEKANPFDPKYRPYRVGAYVGYIALTGAFSVLISWNVVRSVIEMTPSHQETTGRTLSQAECIDRATALWGELEDRRKSLADHKPVESADDDWPAFRVKWLGRHRETETLCALAGRPAMKQVFNQLDKAMDLYTTNTVQYAGETGPTVDKFRDALELARKNSQK